MEEQNKIGSLDKVIHYYNESEDGYRDVWNLDDAHQLNLGLWEKGTNNLGTAMKNLNDQLANASGIGKGSEVLDIGCGVGGTSIYISETTGGNCTGLNINSRQLNLAKEYSRKSTALNRISFCKGDYHNLPFEDTTFDHVLAIETLSHAVDIDAVFSEVSRVLRKGGTFVFAEALRSKKELDIEESKALYDRAFMGCQVDHLYHPDELKQTLEDVDFDVNEVRDWSGLAWPSVKRLKRISYLSKLYNFWKELTGADFNEYKKGNTLLASGLQPAMKKKLWGYYMFKATKR